MGLVQLTKLSLCNELFNLVNNPQIGDSGIDQIASTHPQLEHLNA